jgi:hypothetical protein
MFLAGLLLLASLPAEVAGQEPGSTAAAVVHTGADSGPPTIDPFEAGALGIAFKLGLLGEAWNVNRNRESLVDGDAAVWWCFADRAMLSVEFHAMRVFQHPERAAFVNGLTPVLRWQLLDRPAWLLFLEGGPGISWSDTVVPPRGTRFNYLLVGGGGLMRRLGPQVHALLGARLLHISNNGREGRDRNPDIEAIGGYAGISVGF